MTMVLFPDHILHLTTQIETPFGNTEALRYLHYTLAFMTQTSLGRLTIPFSIALIGFLAYGSQLLFHFIEPGALTAQQTWIFNTLVISAYIGYLRSCFTNPGWVPKGWNGQEDKTSKTLRARPKWCRKCKANKPPRAHHCKSCARCVPKMDHHCPWTTSCVSHRTMPHFCRFLLYSVMAMLYLAYFLYIRLEKIWSARNLPSYLGPSTTSLATLFILCATNLITLFAVGLLLIRNLWCLATNVTTIETWEIERHEALVRKARSRGGYLDGPDGVRIKIQKQEFPFDIGIWHNISQGMGGLFLSWFWPFAATPTNESGLHFETNGFEDPLMSWPPPDPDRMARYQRPEAIDRTLIPGDDYVQAFRERQQEDFRRRQNALHTQTCDIGTNKHDAVDQQSKAPKQTTEWGRGEAGWKDSDGDRLEDFGLDENVEFYDEDDVPLAQLRQKRQSP